MKKGIIFINFMFTLLVSCQKETKSVNENSNLKKSITMNNEINILQKQLLKGLKSTIGDAVDYQVEYANEDVEIEGQILNEILKQNGFKNLTNDEFIIKTKEIFQRELNYSSDKDFLYINNFTPCDRDVVLFQNNTIDYNGFFVFKKNNFIAPLYTIPELIDYQKKYPKIIEFEKNIPTKYTNGEGEDIKMHKWMDEENLLESRLKNIQTTIARNKYLFNDSKADLIWLKFNDKVFLESLVKTFGYTTDTDLLKFVLTNNYKNPAEFGKLLWNSRCNGDIVFNKAVLDLIAGSAPENRKQYLNAISDYIIKDYKNSNSELNTNFPKKAEILGKIAYYSTKMDDSQNNHFRFFGILVGDNGGKRYDEEFKKNNYYNISDFKEVWEETKTGGVSYPGME